MNSKLSYKEALSLLRSGEVVAVPTETVYGLAGRIDQLETLEKIFSLKKRPPILPLIVHCLDIFQAKQCVSGETEFLETLWNYFSPGPLTIVASKNQKILPIITADQETVALRIPKHPLLRKLLKDLGQPLAAPSANLYTSLSPTKAEDVINNFSGKVSVLDGGECELGLESTIIKPDLETKTLFILRPGVITKKDLEIFLEDQGLNFVVKYKKENSQPGSQKEHYKPKVPLIIVESKKEDPEIRSFLSGKYPASFLKKLPLEKPPHLLARYLYSDLRKLSENDKNIIFVIKNKNQSGEIWEAIWNRLEKASSARFNLA